jgi:hypothetical protein
MPKILAAADLAATSALHDVTAAQAASQQSQSFGGGGIQCTIRTLRDYSPPGL